jgi:SOS-response transcriptional repressor LexA
MVELDWSEGELARRSGVNQPTIHRIIAGTSREPRQSNLDKIAKALGTTSDHLRHGGKVTRSNIATGPEIKGKFPLISWVAAGAWHDITEIHPSEAPLYPCPVKCSEHTFVLRVQGISMEPLFRDGDLIFIDPEAEWRHGSYVVARLDDQNEATFKQLIIESGQKYLKPLNKDWPEKIIPINGNCTVVGPVVFSGRAF